MARKRDRRQERRRHHQAIQTVRRREERRARAAAIESVRTAFGELADAADDENVSPEAFADRVCNLLTDDLVARMIADPDFGGNRGAEIGVLAGDVRGRALAVMLAERLSDEPRLVWFVANLAEAAGDLDLAERIIQGALGDLEGGEAADASAYLGLMWLEAGRLGDSIELVDRACARSPEHDELQVLRARCLTRAAMLARIASGDADDSTRALAAALGIEAPPPAELEVASDALARFADRSLLYELRAAVESYVSSDPELVSWRDDFVGEFISEVRELGGLGPFDELGGDGEFRLSVPDSGVADLLGAGPSIGGGADALSALAAERAWLSGPEPTDDEEEQVDEDTVLGRFAADEAAPAQLADEARAWLRHVRYGLWQPSIPAPGDRDVADWSSGGVWVVDLITRRRMIAAIPPEQLMGLPRWSVLAGAMAPVGGIWRSGAVLLPLDPAEADQATEKFLETADSIIVALARERGIKGPRPRRRHHGRPRPHGVLAELADELEPAEADVTSKVVGAALTHLVGMMEGLRRRAPKLTNTDGDPIELIRATFPAFEPLTVRKRLVAQADFEGHEGARTDDEVEGGAIAPSLRWLGRDMTPTEAASSLAQFRAEARKRGWGPVAEPSGRKRWLRGTIRFEPGQIVVEVNSRRRLESVTAALVRAGAGEPDVEYVMTPEMDLAVPGGRLRGPASDEPEVEAAWRQSWLDEPLPALEGSTPRAAANQPRHRVLLEALLRQFEYDADVVAANGEHPMDVDALRAELGMLDGVLGLDDLEEGDEEA
jgi:hypothetical protein